MIIFAGKPPDGLKMNGSSGTRRVYLRNGQISLNKTCKFRSILYKLLFIKEDFVRFRNFAAFLAPFTLLLAVSCAETKPVIRDDKECVEPQSSAEYEQRLFAANRAASAADFYLAGMAALDAGELKTALASFKKAALYDESWPLPAIEAAFLSAALDDPAEALNLAEKARKLAPKNPRTPRLLGGLLLAAGGDCAKAYELISESMAMRPGDEQSCLPLLIDAAICAKKYGEAESALKTAIEKNPAEISNFIKLAAVYEATGRLDEAEKALKKTVELSGGKQAFKSELYRFYLRNGMEKKAADEAKKINEKKPGKKMRPLKPSKK